MDGLFHYLCSLYYSFSNSRRNSLLAFLDLLGSCFGLDDCFRLLLDLNFFLLNLGDLSSDFCASDTCGGALGSHLFPVPTSQCFKE